MASGPGTAWTYLNAIQAFPSALRTHKSTFSRSITSDHQSTVSKVNFQQYFVLDA